MISLLVLIALTLSWELSLAPLRPGGSWMVLKVLPLLLPLRGVLKRNLYTLQWSAMLILLYFAEGIVRATSEHGLAAICASIETLAALVYFVCAIAYVYPYKQAARKPS